MKVWQEFYCTKSGGGCGGYIRIRLDMALNATFQFCCPNCGHKHQRTIEDGRIFEKNRFQDTPKFELVVPKSAYSKNPWTKGTNEERDAVVITPKDVPKERTAFAKQYFEDRWFEIYGDKK